MNIAPCDMCKRALNVDIDARLREVYNFKSTQVGGRVSWEVRSGDNDHDSM